LLLIDDATGERKQPHIFADIGHHIAGFVSLGGCN